MKKDLKNITHVSFEAGLLIKGIDGVLEIIGGFLLLFIDPDRMHTILKTMTQHELSEDPRDFVANAILSLSGTYTISTQLFGAFYLFSHGLIKLILIYFLKKKKYWAYPVSIAFLLAFILYQSYRYSYSHSPFLVILTLFDMAMVYLTYQEYRNIKQG